MKLEPTYDNVVILRDKAEERTKSGLILVEQKERKINQGTIMALGPGKENEAGDVIEIPFKEDQKVVFGAFSGHNLTLDGKEFVIMPASEILAVIS